MHTKNTMMKLKQLSVQNRLLINTSHVMDIKTTLPVKIAIKDNQSFGRMILIIKVQFQKLGAIIFTSRCISNLKYGTFGGTPPNI